MDDKGLKCPNIRINTVSNDKCGATSGFVFFVCFFFCCFFFCKFNCESQVRPNWPKLASLGRIPRCFSYFHSFVCLCAHVRAYVRMRVCVCLLL